MLEQQWSALHFGELKQKTDSEQHVFEVQDYLDDLDPAAVQVELYANGANGNAAECDHGTRAATGGRNKRLRLSHRGAGNTPGVGLHGATCTPPR